MSLIDSVEQLQAMDRERGLLKFLERVPPYQFAIPELSEAGNREATARLFNYRNACGCFAGGLFMGMTVIGFVAEYALSGRGISMFGVWDFLLFLGLFTVSTVLGKTFGVLWARLRAVQLVRRTIQLAVAQRA